MCDQKRGEKRNAFGRKVSAHHSLFPVGFSPSQNSKSFIFFSPKKEKQGKKTKQKKRLALKIYRGRRVENNFLEKF